MKRAQSGLRHQLLANAGPFNRLDPTTGAEKPNKRNVLERYTQDDAVLLYRQSLKALQSMNRDQALELISKACSGLGVPGEYYRLYAEILHQSGQFDLAVSKARLSVERDGQSARGWDTLGAILAARNELPESRHCYENAIRIDPDFVESRHNLANVLQLLGCADEAEFQYLEVLKRAPQNHMARANFACLLNMLGRYAEAWAVLEDVMGKAHGFAKAHLVASAIKYNQGQYHPALEQIQRTITLAPGQIRILIRRAEILCKLGRYDAALDDCTKVLTHFPNDAEALRVKAFILRTTNHPEEALTALELAHCVCPDLELIVDRAWIFAEMGQKGRALELLDQALLDRPGLASALYYRAFLAQPARSHPDVTAMEEIVANTQAPGKDRMRLSFTLGKIHLDAGDGPKAFSYFEQANGLKRGAITYDRVHEERWSAGIAELFSRENLAQLSGAGIRTRQPIFVFGMPRSGTTLVEQILASHPLVRGNGETPYLDMLARSSIFLPGPAGLGAENLKSCAEQYLKSVGVGQSLHFVDKTPANYVYAGLISVLLPDARMIHCRRDAFDTCLSCYSLLFGHGHEFSYNQEELGHYYGLYRSIMAHWNKTLPSQVMLDVDYEKLVTSTRDEIQRILQFCGLPWDDACLRFYETKRLVTTSSLDQVRSPIYRTSMGRARRFRPWLSALEHSLEQNGVTISEHSSSPS